MSIQRLPAELLDIIFGDVTDSDLVALSRTTSSLYPAAQRHLYRDLSISSLSRNFGVVVTLAQSPTTANYVHNLAIRLDDSSSTPFTSFYDDLATALSYMLELTTLDIFVDSEASWVLKGSCPRLQRLTCSFPFDECVARFLDTTEALLELEVDSIPASHPMTTPSLRPQSLRHLTQFTGSSHAAQSIVPGRPVESIHLNSGDLTETVVEALAGSTGHVVILGGNTSSLPVPLLGSLSKHMPHLVYLRIMTMYSFSVVPDATFYAEVSETLSSMPVLNAFELSGMHWGSTKDPKNGEKRIWQSMPLNHILPINDELQNPNPISELSFVY